MRKVITGSRKILESFEYGWMGSPGYWNARGLLTINDMSLLPYSEFHENNSVEGKKNLISVPNTSKTSQDRTVELYRSVNLTQSVTIANGFFLYSAAVLEMYFLLAQYSKELNLPATYRDLMNSGSDKIVDLFFTNVSMEVCARLLYEGSGSLGGYKDKVWLLWGRLTGRACPDNESVLSLEEALDCSQAYRKSTYEQKRMYFVSWFVEAYSSEFLNKDLLMIPVAEKIFVYYERYVKYNNYERGRSSLSSISSLALEDMNLFLEEVKAVLTGIFRRCSKGLTEASTIDYSSAQQLVLAMGVDLKIGDEEVPIFEMAVDTLFTDCTGNLTSFGSWFKETIFISLNRVALIEDLIEEAESNPMKRSFSKFRSV